MISGRQAIGLRPGLDHKPTAFGRYAGDRRQLHFEAVLGRHEYDPAICDDHLARKDVCDVVIDRLTGAAARSDRHTLRDPDADAAAGAGPADGLRLRDIAPRRREEVGRFTLDRKSVV